MVAARALHAYRSGQHTSEAFTGALLEAEFFDNVRCLAGNFSA